MSAFVLGFCGAQYLLH